MATNDVKVTTFENTKLNVSQARLERSVLYQLPTYFG